MPNPRTRKPAPAPGPATLPSITVRPESGSDEGDDLGPLIRRPRGPGGPGRPGKPGRPDPATLIVTNQAKLRTNSRNIYELIQAERPKNTDLSYGPKQAEFRRFCRLKQYHDGKTITKDKLLLFLVKEITSQPLQSRSRTAAAGTPYTESRLAWRSVCAYVTAITDLYRTQRALGINNNPSP